MGASAAQGIPGAMLFVNAIVMGAAICSNLIFAFGLRGRDKKKKQPQALLQSPVDNAAVVGGGTAIANDESDATGSVIKKNHHGEEHDATATGGDAVDADDESSSSSSRSSEFMDRVLEIARFHVYAGVLFPCSSVCGWTHAAASCFHANLAMLFAAVIGLYVASESSVITAFGIGVAVPPLGLLMVRYLLVEQLALPCLLYRPSNDILERTMIVDNHTTATRDLHRVAKRMETYAVSSPPLSL
jgi:hypothetical protein